MHDRLEDPQRGGDVSEVAYAPLARRPSTLQGPAPRPAMKRNRKEYSSASSPWLTAGNSCDPPASFQWTDTPQIDVQFNIIANAIDAEIHEIELKVSLTSKCEGGTAFLVELAYCGLVGMRGLAPEQMHAFMYAEAPRILFPFARRIVADAVRDAGFPPVMLEPIDFNGLYIQQLAQQQQVAEAEPAGHA